ncbi:DUF6065 family protein [Rhizobium paknamense]|uniref:Uncharacterized protein n=1 Tax=Rhizobium paknamense TaxID=1206817 RepID=A0ABU0IJA7_9HYPH|nr:DUF6065 family protein [Rhizobium paknamense]MDQ0458340.1 hypothetical protein [Rhizobium paknamense]
MKLMFYRLNKPGGYAPVIRPAPLRREWMDATKEKLAYRCTPMTIANVSGWELVLPCSVRVNWNGRNGRDDLHIEIVAGEHPVSDVAISHFGSGIVTFFAGYLVQTDPGAVLMVRGSPNSPKDGACPLEGMVETDWLPFPFTMNWMMTRPGEVTFNAGEPFSFLTPVNMSALDELQPELDSIDSNPSLFEECKAWQAARKSFNRKLSEGDPVALEQGWQRNYLQGRSFGNLTATEFHLVKRKLRPVISSERYRLAFDSEDDD